MPMNIFIQIKLLLITWVVKLNKITCLLTYYLLIAILVLPTYFMTDERSKHLGLGYLKSKHRWGKPKLKTKIRHMPTLLQSQLFNELEEMVNEEQQQTLTFDTRCQCKICNNIQEQQHVREDLHMASSPNAYLNLFTLLQHLTMVEADEAPTVLGALQIPMLFFKRQSRPNKDLRLSRYKSKDSIIPNQNQNLQHPFFIFFKSDEKTGHLQYPMFIQSLQKVSKLIKSKQQMSRRQMQQQYKNKMINLSKSSQFTDMTHTQNVIHKKFFNEAIPPYKFASLKTQKLKSAAEKFIIHEQDRYISQQIQSHKMKQSQPFCIFRYMGEEASKRVSKYEIFTMHALQIYERNLIYKKDKKNQENLNLLYIQSFIRIKSKPIIPIKLLQGILSLVGLAPDGQAQQALQMVYYTQFSVQQTELNQCQLFNLAKLQVRIRSGRMSHIDPNYLDHYGLQSRLADVLQLRQPPTKQRIKRIVKYKTYKIIHVLDIVCRIITSSLRLKWLLAENDEVVLTQCIQYKIDRERSLKPRKNKDAHVEHIIDNGIEFLSDNKYEDLQNIGRSHADVEQIIQSRIQQRQEQASMKNSIQVENDISQQVGTADNGLSETHKMHLRKLSRSMQLQSKGNNTIASLQAVRKMGISADIRKAAPARAQSVPTTIMEYAHNFNIRTFLNHNSYGNYNRMANYIKHQTRQSNYGQHSRFNTQGGNVECKIGEVCMSNTEYIRGIKEIKTKYSPGKKSYKLKPFKTQSSQHSPD